jgi:hypothetical protein
MRNFRITVGCAALVTAIVAAWGHACGSADAQDLPLGGRQDCFEVIPARPGTLPSAPLLINKCSGATYVLATKPNDRRTYYWKPIQARAADDREKCFTYNNRVFCE